MRKNVVSTRYKAPAPLTVNLKHVSNNERKQWLILPKNGRREKTAT